MATPNTDIVLQRARQAFVAGQMERARGLCEQILAHNRNNANAVVMMGQIDFAQNRLDDAATHMLKATALQPKDPRAFVVLGEIRTFQGRFDDAIGHYDEALRLDPENPTAIAGKADTYERSGRADKARALLEPIVAGGRETAQQCVIQARLDLRDRNYDAVIDRVGRHLDRGDAEDSILRNLCRHLGQALERTGRFDEAFCAYTRGNSAVPAHFDPESWREAIEGIIESFSPQRFDNLPRASHGARDPIFVVGLPRCGSTLVETILDAHPDVAGAGELTAMQELINSISLEIGSNLPYPVCIEDLDRNDVNTIAGKYLGRLRQAGGRATAIVDKYLNNYLHVGMLAVLFPEAPIIHCRRHPLDTCFSCFTSALVPSVHPYTCDLAHMGVVYVAYERLMSHWRDVLKIPMLEVRYEAVVADQEGLTRRMLDYCGLDFDERCLRFYERQRPVLTASYDQVSQPVYSSSVGRYRNFEDHLGPLRAALAAGGWTEEALERGVR